MVQPELCRCPQERVRVFRIPDQNTGLSGHDQMSKVIAAFRQSQIFHFVMVEVLVVLIEHGLDQ
jgi:hypothetical protein